MTAVDTDIAPFQINKVRPPLVSRGKTSQQVVSAGRLNIGVQSLGNEGGETNLHSHPNSDSAWMVLQGKAKFYTVNDRLLGELGKYEVISIPAGTPYWFDTSDPNDPLVILHITSKIPEVHTGRIDYSPRDVGGENRIREVIPGKFFGDD